MTDSRPEAEDSMFRSPSHRRRALLAVGGLLGTLVVVTVSVWWVGLPLFDPVWMRSRIEAMGPAAPVVFVLIQVTQVVFAPVPGQLLTGVGGYLFGSVFGTLYSMLGMTIGSTVVFITSRRYGRPFVVRVLDSETLNRVDRFMTDYGSAGLFIAFLLPMFPDDVLCLMAGLTELRYRRFLLLLLVGRTPTFLASAVVGTSLANGHLGRVLVMLAGLAVVSTVVYYFRSGASSTLRPLID